MIDWLLQLSPPLENGIILLGAVLAAFGLVSVMNGIERFLKRYFNI